MRIVTLAGFGFGFGLACAGSEGGHASPLEHLGRAKPFSLSTQDGERLSLEQLRGKVVIVTFVFTTCAEGCSPLTAKLAGVAEQLAPEERPEVFLAFVTLTPELDGPDALRGFAQAHGLDLEHAAFLTGTPAQVREVAEAYGVAYGENAAGRVEHTFLTSVVDRRGDLRVQYLGIRFDPQELLGDVRSLVKEDA